MPQLNKSNKVFNICINDVILLSILTISSRSDMIAPNVIDITGPINGLTSIAATIFGALFSTNPSAASELLRFAARERDKDNFFYV